MTTIIQENVNGARVVRAFANESYEFEKMDKANKAFRDKSGKFNTVLSLYWGCSDFVVFSQYALTMTVGIFLAKKGILGAADIVAAFETAFWADADQTTSNVTKLEDHKIAAVKAITDKYPLYR